MSDCNPIDIAVHTGQAMLPHMPTLQRLRATVFRDWPYLYDADPNAVSYSTYYADDPAAALILATDGDRPVGAATCIPLASEGANVNRPFVDRGWDISRWFYFGESVLLAPYRGRGIGVAFFDAREAQARRHGAEFACFCSVARPTDHPQRPHGDAGLAVFWGHRGYAPYPGLSCTMTWQDVGRPDRTPHRLDFWVKSLSGAQLP